MEINEKLDEYKRNSRQMALNLVIANMRNNGILIDINAIPKSNWPTPKEHMDALAQGIYLPVQEEKINIMTFITKDAQILYEWLIKDIT